MLKSIPRIIPPELMKVLMEMGHGDEIILGDGNFPGASCANRLIRCDGSNIPEILEAILKFLPLDSFVEFPVALMAVVPGDSTKPVIWEEYRKIINKYNPIKDFEYMERFKFYERTKKAYSVVATGEKSLYANIILKKGIVTE